MALNKYLTKRLLIALMPLLMALAIISIKFAMGSVYWVIDPELGGCQPIQPDQYDPRVHIFCDEETPMPTAP